MTGSGVAVGAQAPRWLKVVVVVVVSALLVTAAGALGARVGAMTVSTPGLRKPPEGDPLVAEVERLFGEEYPGWELVDIGLRHTKRGDQGEHAVDEYVVTTVPAGRDYTIGIAYTSTNGRALVNTDKMFREDAPGQVRAESVFEVLEREYVARDRSLVVVKSSLIGSVSVEWERHTGQGLDQRYWHVEDNLWRNEITHEWVSNPY